MSEETIFNVETPSIVEEIPTPSLSLPQEVAELVGEGRKYRSAEDALKSIPHAQAHIKKLEEEQQALKEELAKRKAAEELLEEIKSNGFRQESPAAPVDIEGLVNKVLTQKQQQASAQANQAQVVNAFNAKYGEKGEEMFMQLAKDTGMHVAALNQLAAASPTALFKMAGFDATPTPPAKTSSSVNTESFNSGNTQPLSAKVKQGASTKDLVNAWRVAGQKVNQS